MDDEEKIANLINLYLRGLLDENEAKSFESKLKSDTDLRNKYELLRDISKGVRISSARRLKHILSEREGQITIPGKTRYLTLIITIAASILVIIAAVYIFTSNQRTWEELFASHFTPYPIIASPVTRAEDESESVWNLYEQGKFDEALIFFNQEMQINPDDATYAFYAGICHLALDNPGESIDLFLHVMEAEDDKFTLQAQWYLGLAYLKADKQNEARETFNALVTNNNEYSERAKDIIKEL